MPKKSRANWFDAHPRQAKWLVALVCLVMIEGLIRLGVAAGWLPYRLYPTSTTPQYWDYIDPIVGLSVHPHAEFRMQDRCMDADYRANSIGARDTERSLESTAARRVIVLGDSYVEGYGVNVNERFTNLLEARTGIEHLNFGFSGGFGTIQQWLYYENYASRYEHTDVMLFVFPGNDFRDNDPGEFPRDVYRPYLRRVNGEVEIYYTVPFEKRYRASRRWPEVVKNTVDNNVYLLNVLRKANRLIKDRSWGAPTAQTGSYYDDHTESDIDVFLTALGGLADHAGSRSLHVFLLPAARDFEHARRHGTDFALVTKLRQFAADRQNLNVHDLLPEILPRTEEEGGSYSSLTLDCDAHFSERGNRVIADLVYEAVFAAQGG